MAKLGFTSAAMPRRLGGGTRRAIAAPSGLGLIEIGHVSDLLGRFRDKPSAPSSQPSPTKTRAQEPALEDSE
jgi:hypothetical protein